MLVRLQSVLCGNALAQGEVGSAVDRAGRNTLALCFHLNGTLLLVSKETESLSFNGEMKCTVEPMKKMAKDMERLGAH